MIAFIITFSNSVDYCYKAGGNWSSAVTSPNTILSIYKTLIRISGLKSWDPKDNILAKILLNTQDL